MKVGDMYYRKYKDGEVVFGKIARIEDNYVYNEYGELFLKENIVILETIKNYYLVEMCDPTPNESFRINKIIESEVPLNYVEIYNKFSLNEARKITKIEVVKPIN